MRCKKHLSDLSSSVGVCSSCLRDRLFALIAAQEQHAQLRTVVEDRRNSDARPPPLAFPRSVSPYVSRRKSDDPIQSGHNLDLRFYSTPQIGTTHAGDQKKKRFSFLSSLFRTRSDNFGFDSRDWSETSSSSPSWFSTFLPGRRKKQLRQCSLDETTSNVQRHGRRLDRGMSPAGTAEEEEDCDRFPSGSAHSSETTSPQPWRRTPVAGPHRKGRASHGRNVSGLAFCLSPLVRASPSRQWKQNGAVLAPELSYSGEVRASPKPHISTAASFCANRSRKIADFGRANRNR